jgi:hypothetical protein
MRFVLRARRNWSVKSLAHVSLRPSGTAGRLPRLVGVRLAMVWKRQTRSSRYTGMRGSGVAWVLESAKVVRARRAASQVVVVCGFELHSPCTWIVAFTAGEILEVSMVHSIADYLAGSRGLQRFKGTGV